MPMSAVLASMFLATFFAGSSVAVRPATGFGECPSSLQVESALRQTLGQGEPSAGAWVLSYGPDAAASGTSHGADVLMELVDPAGGRVSARRIPSGDCAAVASAMAAVVERSLRTLGWTKGEPLPETTRRTAATPSSPPPARKRPPRLVLGLGPSLGAAPQTSTNLLLEARAGLAGPFLLSLAGGIFAGSDSESVGAGKASVSSRSFTAAPLLAFAWGPVDLAGGPTLLLSFDHGSSQGIAVTGSGDRQVLAVGAGLSAALRLSARWQISLGLEGFRVAAGGDYFVEIDGKRTVVLKPSPWQGIATAKMEFVIWR